MTSIDVTRKQVVAKRISSYLDYLIWHNSSPLSKRGRTGRNYEFPCIEWRSGNIGTNVRRCDHRSCSDRAISSVLATTTIQYNTIKLYSTVEQTATVYIVLRNKTIDVMTTNQYMSENNGLDIKFRFSVLMDNVKLCRRGRIVY